MDAEQVTEYAAERLGMEIQATSLLHARPAGVWDGKSPAGARWGRTMLRAGRLRTAGVLPPHSSSRRTGAGALARWVHSSRAMTCGDAKRGPWSRGRRFAVPQLPFTVVFEPPGCAPRVWRRSDSSGSGGEQVTAGQSADGPFTAPRLSSGAAGEPGEQAGETLDVAGAPLEVDPLLRGAAFIRWGGEEPGPGLARGVDDHVGSAGVRLAVERPGVPVEAERVLAIAGEMEAPRQRAGRRRRRPEDQPDGFEEVLGVNGLAGQGRPAGVSEPVRCSYSMGGQAADRLASGEPLAEAAHAAVRPVRHHLPAR